MNRHQRKTNYGKYRQGILDQLDINSKNICFITSKDYKENFLNNPTVRLINPAENELGRISKAIIDKITNVYVH